MAWLSEISSALRVRMSPRLLRWFTSYSAKGDGRKLGFQGFEDGRYEYEESELEAFDKHLREAWPAKPGERPHVPTGIHEEVKIEAACGCGLCEYMNDCEAAHIKPVATSFCNHPHNLLWACPNHHTAYDHGHQIHGTVDKSTIKAVKKDLLEARVRRWRAEARVEGALVLLVAEAEQILERLKRTTEPHFHKAVERQAKEILASVREAAVKPAVEQAAAPQRELGKRVASIDPSDLGSALEQVGVARRRYFEETGEVECPLCGGQGGAPQYESCPACSGTGTMNNERAREIDLSQYQMVTCSLCGGKGGTHDYEKCPVCGGEGELPRYISDDTDFDEYRMAECPLCEGKGHSEKFDKCPACAGSGELPKQFADQVDVSAYAFVDCPLCKRKGFTADYDTCPACGAEGEMTCEAAAELDLSQYEFVQCAACHGKRLDEYDNRCGSCGGDGRLPRYLADG